MTDLRQFGTSEPFRWTHEHLVQLLGSRMPPNTNPLILNAFRTINRGDFVQYKFKKYAHQDKDIPIGYGENSTSPFLLAKIVTTLDPRFGEKYLHLGSGTGYLATILASIAGDKGDVFSLERVQWLWERARENLKKYPHINSLKFLYRDGKEGLPDNAPFDGIIFSYIPEEITEEIKNQITIGGKLIVPTSGHMLKVLLKTEEDQFEEELIPDFNTSGFNDYTEGIA